MSAPWYRAKADEVVVFEAAYRARIPILLRGPTGCGKTRFIEHMAWRLGASSAQSAEQDASLVTVACHDDLSASDLVGRYLLTGDTMRWIDGPLTRAARIGAICYLDEMIEARRDTTVVIHSLTDHRRILSIEKTGELLQAHPDFLLVVSYNPGNWGGWKELKGSTRQRFIALEFGHPTVEVEAQIIAHEAKVDLELAGRLALIGNRVRHVGSDDLHDGLSTRLLVYAAKLAAQGLELRRACEVGITLAVTDDLHLRQAIENIVDVALP